MKCPSLKTKYYERNLNDGSVAYSTEVFADCMGEKCPYFSISTINNMDGDGVIIQKENIKSCKYHAIEEKTVEEL